MRIRKANRVMARKAGKLETIKTTLKELDITITDIEKNEAFILEMKKAAHTVHDYRHQSYVKHLLEDILMICLFAVLADCDEWEEMADFAREKETWLKNYLELPNGVPSSDTIRVVISGIDTKHFYHLAVEIFIKLINEVQEVICKEKEKPMILSMDGKESKGSKRSKLATRSTKALHTLNVYSTDYGICVEQEFVEEKTNEILAGVQVLGRMDLKDCVVTWDALNTQKETVETVIKKKGEYVAALKGNHPLFYKEVKEFFSEEELEKLKKSGSGYKKTVEKEHGGIAIREYYQTEEIDWYEERKKWKKLRSFGMVKKRIQLKNGEEREETRYYISSLGRDIELFARATRGHWGVENNLHWQLDVTFQDDRNTTAEKTGAKNLQVLKKIALGVLQLVQTLYGQSLKRIRKTIARNCEKELEQILSAVSGDAIKVALYKKQTF